MINKSYWQCTFFQPTDLSPHCAEKQLVLMLVKCCCKVQLINFALVLDYHFTNHDSSTCAVICLKLSRFCSQMIITFWSLSELILRLILTALPLFNVIKSLFSQSQKLISTVDIFINKIISTITIVCYQLKLILTITHLMQQQARCFHL